MRKIVNGLRVLSIIMFGIALFVILSNINPDAWDINRALNIGNLLLVLLWILSMLIGIVAGRGVWDNTAITVYESIWYGIFGQSPDTPIQTPGDLIGVLFQPDAADITPGALFVGSIVSFILIMVLPIATMAAIGFLRNCDTKLATIAFVCLQLVLITGFLTDFIIDTLSDSLVQDYSSDSIPELLQSLLFQTGLLTYLYLEISLSAAYSYRIVEPLVGRRRRIISHIKHVRDFVPSRQEEETETTAITSMPTSSRGGKFSMEAMSYLRESLERRIFKRKDVDYKTNQRLKSYFETLLEQNSEAEQTLTAESVSPKASRIALAIAPNLIIRMVVVIIVAWAVLNPSRLMTSLILLPRNARPLIQSLELTQPELLLLILTPIVIGFVILGFITSTIRDRWLVQRDEAAEISPVPSETVESTQTGSEP